MAQSADFDYVANICKSRSTMNMSNFQFICLLTRKSTCCTRVRFLTKHPFVQFDARPAEFYCTSPDRKDRASRLSLGRTWRQFVLSLHMKVAHSRSSSKILDNR